MMHCIICSSSSTWHLGGDRRNIFSSGLTTDKSRSAYVMILESCFKPRKHLLSHKTSTYHKKSCSDCRLLFSAHLTEHFHVSLSQDLIAFMSPLVKMQSLSQLPPPARRPPPRFPQPANRSSVDSDERNFSSTARAYARTKPIPKID